MALLKNRLSGPARLTNAAATVYGPVPAGKAVNLILVWANNTTNADATLTVSIGANSADTQIITSYIIAANTPEQISIDGGGIPLVAGEIVQALSGTNNALNLTLCGTVEDV